jgi:hypothetical protein
MRKSLFLPAACLAASVCLAGCLKEKQDFTVNPNGSGKVTCELHMTLPHSDAPIDANEEARKAAQNIVKMSEGVTAWKDVTFSGDKDGKMTIKGTAYFQDISKFKLAGENISVCWKPVADGAIQLEFVAEKDNEPAPTEPPKLTEEEIKQKIADAKAHMTRDLPILAEGLGDVQMVWTFALPGPVEKSVNFQAVADKPNTVRLTFDGKKMLDFLKAFSEDEASIRAKIVAGKDPLGSPDPELLNEKLFGTRGPITVSFKPGDKPLFDWAAESEAAKKAMPIPGLEAPAPATTAK